MMLPVSPEVFDRIQFRCIGGQPFQHQGPFGSGNEVSHHPTLVAGQPVPHHQQRPGNMTPQVLQEFDDLWTLDGSRIQSKVEAPPSDSSNGRQTLPVEVILQHRSLSPRRPRAIPIGSLAQPAFVHKHYGSPLVSGLRPALPLSANCRAHRFTDWRCTPTQRAGPGHHGRRWPNRLGSGYRRGRRTLSFAIRMNGSSCRRSPTPRPIPAGGPENDCDVPLAVRLRSTGPNLVENPAMHWHPN